jgi:hypothetical protein
LKIHVNFFTEGVTNNLAWILEQTCQSLKGPEVEVMTKNSKQSILWNLLSKH